MEQLKVIEFLEGNKEYLFPNKQFTEIEIENALVAAPDSFETAMRSIPFRKPSTLKFIAVFPGSLGVDRFYLGDILKGIVKYFTLGGFGVWWIADIVSAKERCRIYNCKKLLSAVNDPSVVAKMKNTDAEISHAFDTAKQFAPVAKEVVKGAKEIGKTFYYDD